MRILACPGSFLSGSSLPPAQGETGTTRECAIQQTHSEGFGPDEDGTRKALFRQARASPKQIAKGRFLLRPASRSVPAPLRSLCLKQQSAPAEPADAICNPLPLASHRATRSPGAPIGPTAMKFSRDGTGVGGVRLTILRKDCNMVKE